MQTLLPGIAVERVPTSQLTAAVLSVTGRTGDPVLFVHGNVSSSLFWQPTMLALPDGYRPLAVDLRGFGETDPEPVDATRGLATTPTIWPRSSRRWDCLRSTWWAGAWAAGWCCSTSPNGPRLTAPRP